MDFDESPEEAAFRLEVRAFLAAHASPKTGTVSDWSRGPTDESHDAQVEFLRRCQAWQRTLFDNGWAGITWPTEHGGRGGTIAESILFDEEAAAFDATSGFLTVGHSLVGPPLMRHGRPDQQQRYLRPLLRGDEVWCQLFSEPGAGSDLAALATRAVLDGDEWVVNGSKVWSSEAQHADHAILIARTDADAPKHRGITFFVLDMATPGIDVRPLRQATGQSQFNEVFLTDVHIPAENVVGEVDGGWAVTRTVLSSEATMIGSGGSGPDSYASLVRLATDLGRTADPLVRQALADVWARERMLRLMGLRLQTFALHGWGTPPDPSALKNFMTLLNWQRAHLGIHLQGPAGTLDGPDAMEGALWQHHVIGQYASRIGGGTNEVHRNMIAERALGLPREPQTDRDVAWRDLART
jgi:alkylation response protein AidB-like acyl-CoA dehydrogenase